MTRRWAVPAGSLVLATTAYGFLIVAGRALGPEGYAPLAALWALIFAAVPPLFLPLEQELTRTLSVPEPVGKSGLAASAVGCRAGLTILVAVGVLGIPVIAVVRSSALDDDHLLLLGLCLAVLGHGCMHLSRGLLLGGQLPGWYGGSLAGEGSLRLILTGLLALTGVAEPGPYGVVLGGSTLVVAGAVLPRALLVGTRRVAVEPARLTRNLLAAVPASVMALTLINAGPFVANILADSDNRADVGRLLAGLALVRIPMFALPTLQSHLLPSFSRAASAGDSARSRELLLRVVAIHVVLTVVAGTAIGAIGPGILRLAFGEDFQLGSSHLVVLALGSAGHMLATLFGLGLTGAGRNAALVAAWGAGLAAATAVVILVPHLLLRIEMALLVGSWTAAGAMACAHGLIQLPAGRRAT